MGVPLDITVPSYFHEDAVPSCEEQFAIVKDNNDPEGLSRIRVQFPWQMPKNELSPWLRVTTPYAGEGKGFHVLPELEEEVLIGFENGNAEKTYCLGAMFHGKGKSGHGGDGNFVKGFQTAAGQRMQMNDEEGSLYLQDNGNANMRFDGAGNATTNVNVNHNVNVGSMSAINVGATKEQPPQSTFVADSDGNIVIDAKTSILLMVGDNSIKISKDGIITIAEDGDIGISASKTIQVVAPKNHINGETKIDGGDVFIN